MPNIKTVVEVFKAFLNPSTTKFPDGSPDHLPEGFKGKIQLNQDTCIGCGACLQVCPSFSYTHLQEKDKKLIFYDPTFCIFCEECVKNCPTESLVLTKIYDMSSSISKDTSELFIELDMQLCTECKEPITTLKHLDWIKQKLIEALIPDDSRKKLILNEFAIARYYCPKCRKIKAKELNLHTKKLF
ncbi:MAG: 4Fe-4S dicluster domain-containing protein [Candidatus Hodarchaeota archaeon]